MPYRHARPANAAAAFALLACACLTGAVALAQRADPVLPETMRPPPAREGAVPTSPGDGRVGDPLPAAQLLIPQTQAGVSAASPDDLPATLSDTEAPPHAADDGAVGDLVASVSNTPRARPSQTEIDGHAGELLAYVPRVPSPRPPTGTQSGSQAIDAALAPGGARQSPMQMTAEEKQCRARLTALGATFRERDRLTDPSGCLVPFPIVLTALGGGIGIEPDAVLNCEAAVALAEYAQGTVSDEAEKRLGAALATINHASAYVCRGRVGTGESKLSEHAFGNAIDIGSFELEGGRTLDVRAYGPSEQAERDFMRSVRGAACGPWKTVLGPGTNAEHATHFHLDLAERRRGGTYCR